MNQRDLTTLQIAWEVREMVNDLTLRDRDNPLAQQLLSILPDVSAEYQALYDNLPNLTTEDLRTLSKQAGPGMLRFRIIEIIHSRGE